MVWHRKVWPEMVWNGIVGWIDIISIICDNVTDNLTDNLSENMTTKEAIASKKLNEFV